MYVIIPTLYCNLEVVYVIDENKGKCKEEKNVILNTQQLVYS
jgi:hypothetical protein